MRLRFSSYFIGVVAIASLTLLVSDLALGLAYVAAVSPLALFVVRLRRARTSLRLPVFVAVLGVYVLYFVRPVFLGLWPEFFGYPDLGLPSRENKIVALLAIGGFSATFVSALYLVLLSTRLRTARGNSAGQRSVLGSLRYVYLLFLTIVVGAWMSLVFGLNVGVKGVTSSYSLIQFLLPVDLVIPAALGYLGVGTVRKLTHGEKTAAFCIVAAMVLITVLRGSKGGAFMLLLYGTVLGIFLLGDVKIRLARMSLYAVASMALVVLTVVSSNVVRYRGLAGLSEVGRAMTSASASAPFVIDRITFRFNGYDGFLATLLDRPPGLEGVMEWRSMLRGGVEKLVPGVGGGALSVGKAVGVYYGGKDLDADHAGALGLFGVLHFMHGMVGGLLVAAFFGGVVGVFLTLVPRLPVGSVERLVLIMFLCYQMVFWLSSGNVDVLIQQFVISTAHCLLYYGILSVVYTAVRRQSMPTGLLVAGS